MNKHFQTFETIFLCVLILIAASVACSQQITTAVPTTPAPTLEPTVVITPTTVTTPETTLEWTATVQRAQINVRNEPAGDTVVGYLKAGDEVTIVRCVGDWCKIAKPAGWVFQGCLSFNPRKLGCEAK